MEEYRAMLETAKADLKLAQDLAYELRWGEEDPPRGAIINADRDVSALTSIVSDLTHYTDLHRSRDL